MSNESINITTSITQTSLSLSPSIASGLTTWGSITGTLSNQTDLQNILNNKISLTSLSSTATGLTYNNTTGVFSLTSGYEIPLSSSLNSFITKDVDNLTYYTKTSDLPSVNNGLLTIQKNGTTLGTFTANQATSETVNIVVPTKTSDLTNDGDTESPFATEEYVDLNGGKINTIQKNGVDLPITNKTVNIAVPTKTSDLTNDSNFVVDSNYVHTENNFSNSDKSKLNSIEAGAQVNTVNSVNSKTGNVVLTTSDLQNDSGYINKDVTNLTNYMKTSDINTELESKQDIINDLSTIRYGAGLGATSLQPNDNISELVNNAGYITSVTQSDVINALGYRPYSEANPQQFITKDASGLTYYTDNTHLQSLLNAKQDTLVSGTNIKTINNQSLLGSGNIVIQGGSGTSDHSQLTNRDIADQHPISAITNLQTTLDRKVEDLSDLGITATASEINVLDGITATTTELNYVDGVTSSIQTQLNNKVPTSEKGIASGVATLDTNGKVPLTQINDALLGNVKYMGLWDASTGTAPSASPTKGNYWITSTAGTFSSKYYEVGDWIICNATDPSVVWDIVRNTDAVSSVEGRTGNVTVISDTSGSGATTYTWSADKLNTEFDKKVTGNTAITGATHSKITYDSKGLVTSGADLTLSDLSITATASEINVLDGITASTSELNILDGVTATASEINVLDGITASTSELNILDGVTATASEINVLDGITATTTELNYTDGVTSNIQTQLNNKSLVTFVDWE